MAIKAEVTAPDDVTAMVSEVDQRWDSVDELVHNALVPFAITSLAELTWEQLGGKLDRELRAAFLITKADEAQRRYERYIGPYDTYDGQADLDFAQQATDAVATEPGVASGAADEIDQPARIPDPQSTTVRRTR